MCKNLFSPYISVRYDVVDDDGATTPFTAELTYEQFKELKASFEKMVATMDVV